MPAQKHVIFARVNVFISADKCKKFLTRVPSKILQNIFWMKQRKSSYKPFLRFQLDNDMAISRISQGKWKNQSAKFILWIIIYNYMDTSWTLAFLMKFPFHFLQPVSTKSFVVDERYCWWFQNYTRFESLDEISSGLFSFSLFASKINLKSVNFPKEKQYKTIIVDL